MKLLKILLFSFISISFSQEPGDECVLYNGELGFLECNLSCYPLELLDNIGNGSCDEECNSGACNNDGGDCE